MCGVFGHSINPVSASGLVIDVGNLGDDLTVLHLEDPFVDDCEIESVDFYGALDSVDFDGKYVTFEEVVKRRWLSRRICQRLIGSDGNSYLAEVPFSARKKISLKYELF